MAIADYFSKDVLAISQVLKQTDTLKFESILNCNVIEIAFDNSIKQNEGKFITELLVLLIARLYPVIKLTDLSSSNSDIKATLIDKAQSINKKIEITSKVPTVSIVVGNTATKIKETQKVFYLGSNDWTVKMSTNSPVGIGDSAFPFSAGISACLGAANCFKCVFEDLLNGFEIDQDFEINLLDIYNIKTKELPTLDNINLGFFTLIGMGAIGNGFVWALSNFDNANGECTIIDYEEIELSNLQRYCLTEEKHINLSKVEHSKQFLRNGIKAIPFNGNWNKYLQSSEKWDNEFLCVAVDSMKDRISIQSSLPKSIINAYTENNLAGVCRHLNFIDDSCLSCGYIPNGKKRSYSQEVSDNLNISDKERIVRDYLYHNKLVDVKLLGLVSNANNIELNELKMYEGVSMAEFYSSAVCGGKISYLKKDSSKVIDLEAPLSFQSALAGILLAFELFICKTNLQRDGKNNMHFYPLSRINKNINPYRHTLEKDTTGRCICNDKDFTDFYEQKWK